MCVTQLTVLDYRCIKAQDLALHPVWAKELWACYANCVVLSWSLHTCVHCLSVYIQYYWEPGCWSEMALGDRGLHICCLVLCCSSSWVLLGLTAEIRRCADSKLACIWPRWGDCRGLLHASAMATAIVCVCVHHIPVCCLQAKFQLCMQCKAQLRLELGLWMSWLTTLLCQQ